MSIYIYTVKQQKSIVGSIYTGNQHKIKARQLTMHYTTQREDDDGLMAAAASISVHITQDSPTIRLHKARSHSPYPALIVQKLTYTGVPCSHRDFHTDRLIAQNPLSTYCIAFKNIKILCLTIAYYIVNA